MELEYNFNDMQLDLNSLHEWSLNWLLPFNLPKCKQLSIGVSHQTQSYTLDESNLNGNRIVLCHIKEHENFPA